MKSILITGAASGIGKAAAELFHRKGWYLGLVDINEDALKALSERLGSCWYQTLDVTDSAATAAAVADFAKLNGGKINGVFNSAGVLRMGSFEQIELTEHRRTFDINVMGLMNVCHAAFPFLKETKGAKIINMSSASALYGVPHLASYSASKFAVRGLTEALNIEWQKFDIHVCDLMPPFVNTPMVTEQDVTPAVVKRLGVNLDPDDVAKAAWTAMNNQAVHFPVGLQFASLMRMSKVLPAKATRLMMDVLSR